MIPVTYEESVKIKDVLSNFKGNEVLLPNPDGVYQIEFGGEIPSEMIKSLRKLGAEVLVYVQRGVKSTVISF